MFIQQVNFEYPNMSPAMMTANNSAERAKPFLDVAGLLWKIWLNTEGGPEVASLTTQIYAVTENPSRVTHAPVPFLANAAE